MLRGSKSAASGIGAALEDGMVYFFELKAEIGGGPTVAQKRFDDFREEDTVSSEHGVLLWNLKATGQADVYSLNAEIEADTEEEAKALFDNVREGVVPSSVHGITFYSLERCEAPASAMGM